MPKQLWRLQVMSPAVLGITLALSLPSGAIAAAANAEVKPSEEANAQKTSLEAVNVYQASSEAGQTTKSLVKATETSISDETEVWNQESFIDTSSDKSVSDKSVDSSNLEIKTDAQTSAQGDEGAAQEAQALSALAVDLALDLSSDLASDSAKKETVSTAVEKDLNEDLDELTFSGEEIKPETASFETQVETSVETQVKASVKTGYEKVSLETATKTENENPQAIGAGNKSIKKTSEDLEELALSAPTEVKPSVEELLGISPKNNPKNNQLAQNIPSVSVPANQVRPNQTSNVLDQINQYSTEDSNGSIGQGVPGASGFSDVSPNDWAFQALDDLVRRYDCLKGYPNGTYRGGRSLTRYEFAAGLNACLQQIERLIAASTAEFVTRADLEALQRLVQEFEAELATLGTRVDSLEGRVSFLEDNQFSTTTKLAGEVIMAANFNFSDQGDSTTASGVVNDISNATFGDRIRLELNTTFTGNDRLVTRLAAGNLAALGTNPITGGATGFEAKQTFHDYPGSNNDIQVDWLAYYFKYGNSQAYLAGAGGSWADIAPTLNPYFEDFDGGSGSLSMFAQRNPIYRIGGGSGGAISFGFSPIESVLGPSTITLGYLASEGPSPGDESGVFKGDYAMMAQLNGNLSDSIGVGLTYVHGYHDGRPIFGEGSFGYSDGDAGIPSSGMVGSYVANNPWVLTSSTNDVAVTNSYGAEVAFRLGERMSLSGFVTKTDVRLLEAGDADVWTYGAGIALPDLGKPGNILGLFAGVQPSLRGIDAIGATSNSFNTDTSWHFEGFYKYQLTDNISITPGVVWITSPNQSTTSSDSAVIGTLRTTFSF